MTAELIWLRNWRLELMESIAELEGYDLPGREAPNTPSVKMALAWTREELKEVESRIARFDGLQHPTGDEAAEYSAGER